MVSEETVSIYLTRVEDLVIIEERIVTARILSHILNISSVISVNVLCEFIKKFKNELFVTYTVQGLKNDGREVFCVAKVDQDELEETTKLFSAKPLVQVASVQKLGSNNSFAAYQSAEKEFPTSDVSLIPIRHPNLLKRETRSTVSASVTSPVKKVSSLDNSKQSPFKRADNVKIEPEKKIVSVKKSPLKNKTSPLKTKKTDKKVYSGAKNASIGAMFNKQAASASKKSKVSDTPSKPNSPAKSKKEVTEDFRDVDSEENKKEKRSEMSSGCSKLFKKVSSKIKTNKNDTKLKRNLVEEDAARKRKRIVLVSDSESDQGNETEDEPIDEEPPPQAALIESDEEVIPPTPGNIKSGRKRVMKKATKVYEDEEGFLITKNEAVYESCSDDEEASKPEEIPVKQPEKVQLETSTEKKDSKASKSRDTTKQMSSSAPKGKGKASKGPSPQSNKQTSLTAFFKKK